MIEVIYQSNRYLLAQAASLYDANGFLTFVRLMLSGDMLSAPIPVDQVSFPADIPAITPDIDFSSGSPGSGSSELLWTTISTSGAMQAGVGYTVESSSLISLLLPGSTANAAKTAAFDRAGGLFRITQATGQQIRFGDRLTTPGITGRVDSTSIGDYLEMIWTGSEWLVTQSIGNFNVI